MSTTTATPETYTPSGAPLPGMRQFGMIIAVLGVVLAAAGFFMSGVDRFYQAYLIAYTFWMGVLLGSMALLMVQYLTGGVWGIILRRPFEAAVRTLPVMTLLFIPIILGMHSLYELSHEGITETDPLIAAKALYLNTPFFLGRQAFYFIVWNVMGHLLVKWSAEHDRTGDAALLDKLSKLSGAGLLIYGLTLTFAMVDWTMSVNPHWFSTIWGMLYAGGQGLSAFAFGIVVLLLLAQAAPLNRVLTSHHFHDLGKFLFAFLMLWAYLTFSQFIIIWSANIPEEIPYYLDRWENSYKYLSIFIIIGHFMLPYALLLSRDIKRNMGKLRVIATWILMARVADYYWHVAPELTKGGLSISLLDVALPLALGGVFISLFVSNLSGRSLLPVNDPALDKVLHHHVH